MVATARLLLARVPRWPRLLAVLTCLLLAGLSVAGARARHDPVPGAAVLVAVRPLGAGHVLAASDVRVERWPRTLLHPLTVSRSVAAGRRLAGPVARGEPITTARLIGPALTAGLRPGTVAVPVQLAQRSAAEFVHPGDRIDLVAAAPDDGSGGGGDITTSGAGPVASDVRVLAVLPPTDTGATVVVATDRVTARRLAGVGAASTFLPVGESP